MCVNNTAPGTSARAVNSGGRMAAVLRSTAPAAPDISCVRNSQQTSKQLATARYVGSEGDSSPFCSNLDDQNSRE